MRGDHSSNKGKRWTTLNVVLGLVAFCLLSVGLSLFVINSSEGHDDASQLRPQSLIHKSLLLDEKKNNKARRKTDSQHAPLSANALQQRLSGLLKSNDFELLKKQLRAIRTGDVGRSYSIKSGEKPVTGGAGHSGPIPVESPLVEEADRLLGESLLVGAPWTRLKFHRSVDRSKTIFVAIANANSNDQCTALVDSIFANAQYPFQIRVGLVETIEDVKSVKQREDNTESGGGGGTSLEMHIKSEVSALDDEFNRHLAARGGDSDESRQKYSDANLPSKIHPEDRDLLFHRSICVHPKYALCNQSKFCPTDYIRVRKVPRSEMLEKGRGVSWMKHLSTMMFRSEQYLLMLDPASGPLGKNWDTALIEQHQQAMRANEASELSKRLVVLSGRVPTTPENAHFTPLSIAISKSAASSVSLCSNGGDALATTLSKFGLPRVATSFSPNNDASTAPQLATTEFLFTEGASFLTRVPLDPFMIDAPGPLYDLILSARLVAAGYAIALPTATATPIVSAPLNTAATLELEKKLSLLTAADSESTDMTTTAMISQRTTSASYLDSVSRAVAVLVNPSESGVFEAGAADGGSSSSSIVKMLPTVRSVLADLIGMEGSAALVELAAKFRDGCAGKISPVVPVKDVRYTIGGYQVLRHRILNEHRKLVQEDATKGSA